MDEYAQSLVIIDDKLPPKPRFLLSGDNRVYVLDIITGHKCSYDSIDDAEADCFFSDGHWRLKSLGILRTEGGILKPSIF